MKIATYNINGINGRLTELLNWLKESKPDIVCLQELKCTNDLFPLKAIRSAGYNAIWQGQKSWNGVAILAKKKLDMEEIGRALPGDENDYQSRYMEVMVNGVVIACLYLPNGNPAPGPKFSYKLEWLKRLRARAKVLLGYKIPVILIGDFNVIPTDLDCHKPESWRDNALFFPEARAAFKSLMKQGWTDAIRHLYPDQKIFTFWRYLWSSFERNAGIRIDHILLSPQIVGSLRKGGVDKQVRSRAGSSDHAPVWIEILHK